MASEIMEARLPVGRSAGGCAWICVDPPAGDGALVTGNSADAEGDLELCCLAEEGDSSSLSIDRSVGLGLSIGKRPGRNGCGLVGHMVGT